MHVASRNFLQRRACRFGVAAHVEKRLAEPLASVVAERLKTFALHERNRPVGCQGKHDDRRGGDQGAQLELVFEVLARLDKGAHHERGGPHEIAFAGGERALVVLIAEEHGADHVVSRFHRRCQLTAEGVGAGKKYLHALHQLLVSAGMELGKLAVGQQRLQCSGFDGQRAYLEAEVLGAAVPGACASCLFEENEAAARRSQSLPGKPGDFEQNLHGVGVGRRQADAPDLRQCPQPILFLGQVVGARRLRARLLDERLAECLLRLQMLGDRGEVQADAEHERHPEDELDLAPQAGSYLVVQVAGVEAADQRHQKHDEADAPECRSQDQLRENHQVRFRGRVDPTDDERDDQHVGDGEHLESLAPAGAGLTDPGNNKVREDQPGDQRLFGNQVRRAPVAVHEQKADRDDQQPAVANDLVRKGVFVEFDPATLRRGLGRSCHQVPGGSRPPRFRGSVGMID